MGLGQLTQNLYQKSRFARKILLTGTVIIISLLIPRILLAPPQFQNIQKPKVDVRTQGSSKIYKYDLSPYHSVTLEEATRLDGLFYIISINVKPSAPSTHNHIREAGVMIMDYVDLIEDKIRMFYNTSKEDRWYLLQSKEGSKHILMQGVYEGYKSWIPPVAAVDKALQSLETLFNIIDEQEEDIVYPRNADGQLFLFPTNVVMEEINLSGFSGNYMDGVKFGIPTNTHTSQWFFIKVRVGQYSAVPTGSQVLGLEILEDEREDPTIYSQTMGTLSFNKEDPKQITSFGNIQGWVHEEGDSVIVDVRKITDGKGYFNTNNQQYRFLSINTAFGYGGSYKGSLFRNQYYSYSYGLRMEITPNLKPNDGILQGIIVEKFEDGKPVAYIFLDEDWKKQFGDTINIAWGGIYQNLKPFKFKPVARGVYMDRIEDDPNRFSDDFDIHEGGIMVGNINRQIESSYQLENETVIMLH